MANLAQIQYIANISSPFFRFRQTLKIKGSSHKKEIKNLYFHKNDSNYFDQILQAYSTFDT